MAKKVYIAGPFFNEAQDADIRRIEKLCEELGLDYYSPQIHSGSADIQPEDRKNLDAWRPVFMSNVNALVSCDLLICCLNWALPPNQTVCLANWEQDPRSQSESCHSLVGDPVLLDIPDSGTVWEMGFTYCANQFQLLAPPMPIWGCYLQRAPKQVNLMLQMGTDRIITSFELLETALALWAAGHEEPEVPLEPEIVGEVE